MAKDFAIEFYSSTIWKHCRESYSKMKTYTCERCGDVATEVHHIIHLTPENITDPEVTLNYKNLMCLCHKCHLREHKGNTGRRYIIDAQGHVTAFEQGNTENKRE